MDVVFTIVSRNYAAQAATLMESLAGAEPAARRVVIAVDGPIPSLEARAEVIEAASLDVPFAAMSLYYEALELNTAVKPAAFRRLLGEPGVGSVTYLDPDIWVYRPLTEVRDGLARAQLCLTPHITRPLAGTANPNDHTILQSGVYNLGFMAARADPEIFALLDWWAEKCRLDCRVDFAGGLFTDQRWMDLAPGLVTTFERLRQPALNLAYWNLEGRDLRRAEAGWLVDGTPLAFFHFSGFDPARPELLSKHQDRTRVAPGSPLAQLLADYAQALLRNGHEAASATPYAFDRFASGRTVTRPMRRAALRAAKADEPAPPGLDAAAEAWLDAPDPLAAEPGLPDLTRLMAQIWREAREAAVFDRVTLEGRLAFHAWFEVAPGADAPAREAARRLLAAYHGGARTPVEPPWREAPHRGPSAEVAHWLRAGSPALPRACAALTAARADLRLRFDGDPEGLLAWCLGVEASAGRFCADLLAAEMLARLASQDDVLLRAGALADPVLADPAGDDLRRRLFTAFTLAHRARWPQALAGPLQAPFAAPAPGLPEPYVSLFQAIWQARGDLQRRFPLDSMVGRFSFLRWLVGGGLAEYGVAFEALPAKVKAHPWTHLARRTLREAPAAEPSRKAGPPCRVLAVVEGQARARRLPAGTVAYDPAANVFSVGGAPTAAPGRASMVCFLTRPGLVAADAVALIAQGVSWGQAIGVWSQAEAASLSAEDAVLGFVDQVWAPADPRTDLPRPGRRLDPARPLDAALAGLVAG